MKRQPSALLAALTLVLLNALWFAFAPVQFGGQAGYVIVTGNSMEPGMHRGDLVILRRAATYEVGDVATYRHPTIGPIIHRIIAREGDRFIFQGDNNAWLDSFEPTQAALMGKQWIYIPRVGKVLEGLRTPYTFMALAGLMGLTVASSVSPQPATRAEKRRRRNAAQNGQQAMGALGNRKEDGVFILAVLALGSLVLAGFAFTRPLSQEVNADLPYQQTGVWQYEAPAPPGVYDSSTVQTGDPIFRRLTSSVTFDFTYQLLSELPADASGTYRLDAEISDESGWQRTIPLQPEQTFAGNSFTATGELDLLHVEALLDSFERQTALQRDQYTIAIVPHVTVSGTLAGQPLQDQWMPRLQFQLDNFQIRPVAPDEATDQYNPSQEALLPRFRSEPNTLSLLSLSLPVAAARTLALGGLALSLVGIAVMATALLRGKQAGEAARIAQRYRALLINVRDVGLAEGEQVVEVASIEDLAKLAEKDGRMILHETRGSTHHYYVRDSSVTYRYQSADEPTEPHAVRERALQ